jgi:hypothetical protein
MMKKILKCIIILKNFIGKSTLSIGCYFILTPDANPFRKKGRGQLLFARLRLFDRHRSFQASKNPFATQHGDQ